MNPITTPLADQIRDLIHVASGPVTLTRIREVMGTDIPQSQVLSTLDALVEHRVLQAEDLPGNRRTYRVALDSVSVPTGAVLRAANSPAASPPEAKAPPEPTVGAAQILTHLSGAETATSRDIATATGGNIKRISVALAKQQQLGRVQGIDGTNPRQYRITQSGRDGLKPVTGKRWAESRTKPKAEPKAAEAADAADAPKPSTASAPTPAPTPDRYARVMARLDDMAARISQPTITVTDAPLKFAVLDKLASQAHPEIAEVLDGIAEDLRRVNQAATPSTTAQQERRP